MEPIYTIYSHAFFVGSFNGNVTPAQLERAGWMRGEIPGIYNNVYSTYYKGHVDAMLELDSDKPDFLKDVCHYRLPFEKRDAEGKLVDPGKRFTIKLGRGTNIYDYTFTLSNLHIYFFPYEIVLFAIEIDDSGIELNALTKAHSGFAAMQFAGERNKEFMEVFQSIVPFISGNSVDNILADGNKFKIFQILQIDTATIGDALLYEVGTLSPVGCIGTDNWLAPSYDYYHDNIIRNNKVSLFDSWRGLALVDSFTMISREKTNPYGTSDGQFFLWRNFYFPLIYLRCIIEKTFCFRRNTAYRRNSNAENLVEEIADMERYYFYNNISYNFMPNLLYDSMALGLGLQEERQELSNQVKERAKEERAQQKELNEKRTNLLTVLLSVFAIFSVVWDLCSITTSAIPSWNKQYAAITFIILGVLAFIGVMYWYFNNKKSTR